MYYVCGLAWEAYYKGNSAPVEKAFDSREDAEAYRDKMLVEHPEAHWSISTSSIHEGNDAPWTKKLRAQARYCAENHLPFFASRGYCPYCNRQIYDKITLEQAASQLITGCPECHKSFAD